MTERDTFLSQRHADACYAYCGGEFKQAATLFAELIALASYAPSASYLGQMYLRGEGVPHSVEKGLELLRQAVSWGDSNAAFSLGALHRSGANGVPVDPDVSKRFFMLAKELGCELPVDEYTK